MVDPQPTINTTEQVFQTMMATPSHKSSHVCSSSESSHKMPWSSSSHSKSNKKFGKNKSCSLCSSRNCNGDHSFDSDHEYYSEHNAQIIKASQTSEPVARPSQAVQPAVTPQMQAKHKRKQESGNMTSSRTQVPNSKSSRHH